MESNVQTKVYKLTDRMDKYHSYSSSKYSSYTHSSNNENKSKSRNPPRGVESSSTTYKHYLNSHDVPQTSQSHRDNDHYHSSNVTSNNVHNKNDTNSNNNAELINSMYNHSTTLIANATVFPKSRIQSISTKEFLNIKSYFEKHILKNPRSIAEKRSSLLISDISNLEGHTNTFVLPRLKIDEFIDSKQVSENVLNISMKWPLEKSGYILRKNIYTKESNNNNNNSNPSVMNKIKHPNFLKKDKSSSLKGKVQEQAIAPSSSKWLIFYVEIRGPYIFFYQLIRKKPISTTKPVHTLKSKRSVMNKMSIENIRKNLVEKPLSRILSMSKSSASRRQAKMIEASPSSASQTADDDNFIPTYPTSSNQHHHASLICTVNDISGPLEILSAKRVLVHYIPLYYSIVTPVITDNNPNILVLSTIQGIDLKEEEPKYLLDQMLIEISNIGVSHVHSFIEETSIVENKSFNLTSLMQTEVQNWHNSLKQGSFIHSDDDLFESISFVPEHKNITDHYESRRNTSPSNEPITEDLFMDFKNYTFPHVPKTEISSEKDSDKIKSIQNQYTQKFYNYCKQIDDAASYHSSSSSNNSISSGHKKSDNNLSDAFNDTKENMAPSTNVFKNRPKAYSISSENPLAKKTTTGNIVEITKTRKPSVDTDIIPEDGKKLLNNENLLSPSRYYRKYSMPEFINNFSSFSNSKYIKSSSSSIKSTNSANKIESSSNKKSVDFHDISPSKLENSNKKRSTDLRDIIHTHTSSSPAEPKPGSGSTDVSQKFAKTSLARNNSRKGATHISEITNRYKNAEPPTPVSDRYKNIDLDSPIVDAQVPTPSLFINNNVINLNEITDQANELINAGSNKKVKKEKKSKRSKDKVKKSLIGAPVLLSHDGANGSSLPGQVGSKVLSIPTRPLNVASKDLKPYSNPAFVEYASNPTKENRAKLMNSSSATNNTITSSTAISTGTGVGTGTDKTSISSIQNPKKLEKSKFYSPFINALSKTSHNSSSTVTSTYKTSLYSSSPKSSKKSLDFNTFSGSLSKTNSKESLRFNKNEISSPLSVSKPSKLGSDHEDNKNTSVRSRDVAIDDIDEGLKLDLKNNLRFEEKLNQFLEGDNSSFSSKKNEEIISKKKEINALNIDTSFYIKSYDNISPAFKSATLNRFSIPSTMSENLPEVPILIQKCVELVEKIGLRTEGIYRLSGNSATIQSLRKKFEVDPFKVDLISPNHKDDSKDSIDGIRRRYSHAKSKSTTSIPLEFSSIESPNNLYDNDIHVVTGCLKSYLRDGIGEDHIPVCTFDLYKEFIHASEIKDYRERMIKFQDVVHMLPGLNFVTLRFICQHLYRVSLYSTINKMTVKNLAIVFGPTLLKPSPVIESAHRLIKDMKRQCEAVEILIENHEFLFGKIEYEEVSDNEEKISDDYDKKTAAKVQEYINNNTYDTHKPVSSSKYVLPSSSTTPTSSSHFRMANPSSPLSSTKQFIGGSNSNNNTNKINSPISSSGVKFTRDFFDKKSNPQTNATTTKTTTSYKLYSDKKPTTKSTTTTSSTITTSYKLHSDKKPYKSSTNTTTSSAATYKPYSITTNLGVSKSNNSNKHDIRSSTPTKLSDMSSSLDPINLNLEKSIFDSLKLNTNTSEESSTKQIHKGHDNYKESSPKINNRKNQDEQDETLVTKNLILNIMKEDNVLESNNNNNNGSKTPRTNNKFTYVNSDKNTKKTSKTVLPNEDSLIKPPRFSSKLNSVIEDKINIKPIRSINKFNTSSYKPLPKITNTGSSLRKEMNRPELPLKNDEFINKNDIKKINIGSYKKEYSSSDYETLKMETNSLPKYNDNTASPSSEAASLSNEEEIIYLSNAKTIFDNNSNKNNKSEGKTISSSLSKHNGIYDKLFERSEKTEKNDILLPSVVAPSLTEHENEFEDEILSPTKDYNKTHLDLTNQSDVSFEMDKDFTIISNEKNTIAFDDSVQFSSIVVPGESKLDESILKYRKEKKLKELKINQDFKTDLELGSLSSEINKEFNNIINHGHHANEENNISDNAKVKMDMIIKKYNEKEEYFNNKQPIPMVNKFESTRKNNEFKNDIPPLKEIKKQLQQSIEKVKEEIKEEVKEEVVKEPIVVKETIEEQPTEEINEENVEKPIVVETDEEKPIEEIKEENVEEPVVVEETDEEKPIEEIKDENVEEPVVVEETDEEKPTEENKEENVEDPVVVEETNEEKPIEEIQEEIIKEPAIEEPVVVKETVEEQSTEEIKEETIEEPIVVEETVEEQPIEEVKKETIEEPAIEEPVVVEETVEEQPIEEIKEETIEEPAIEKPIVVEETVEEQSIEEQSIEEIKEETIEEPAIEKSIVVEETVEEHSIEEQSIEEVKEEPFVVEKTIEEQPIEEVKEETIEEPVVEETVEEQSTEETKEETIEEPLIVEETIEELSIEEIKEDPTVEKTIEEQSFKEIVEVPIPEIRADNGLWWLFIKVKLNDDVEESVVVKEIIEKQSNEEIIKEQPVEEVKEDIIEESVVVEEPFKEQPADEIIEEIIEVPISKIRTDNGLWWLFAKSELSEVEKVIEEPLIIKETTEEQTSEEVKEIIIEEPIFNEEIVKEQQIEEVKEVHEILFSKIRTDNGLWWLFAKPKLEIEEVERVIEEPIVVEETLEEQPNEEVKEIIIEEPIVKEIIEEEPIEDINQEIIEDIITIPEIKVDNGLWWLFNKPEINEVVKVKEEIIEEPINPIGEIIEKSFVKETEPNKEENEKIIEELVIIKEKDEEQLYNDINENINEKTVEVLFSEIRADNGLWWLFTKPELNEVEEVKEEQDTKETIEEQSIKSIKEEINEVSIQEIRADNGLWWLFAKPELNEIEEVNEKIIEEPFVVVEEQPVKEDKEEIIEIPFSEIRTDNGLWWLFAKPEIKEQHTGEVIEVLENEQPIKEYKIEDSTIVKETKEEYEIDEKDFQLIEKHLSEVIKGDDLYFNLSSIPEEQSEDEFNILSDITEEETENSLELETENINVNGENKEIKE
jgi:hypothetical protein